MERIPVPGRIVAASVAAGAVFFLFSASVVGLAALQGTPADLGHIVPRLSAAWLALSLAVGIACTTPQLRRSLPTAWVLVFAALAVGARIGGAAFARASWNSQVLLDASLIGLGVLGGLVIARVVLHGKAQSPRTL